ncbi:MAG TPA: YIP1 family protein [Vicinamibacterales bacterium]|nr:YIP1 family protein [Vicinamibacterales bacterium]
MTAPAPAPASKNLVERIFGVFFSPRATYADVADRPRAFGVLAFIVLVGAIGVYAFMSTEVGKQAMLDQQVRTMESFGMKIDDAAYARMETGVKYAPYTGAAGQAIVLPLVGALLAGILLGVFNALLGGDATYKQVFAIVCHSGLVISLAQIFGLPLAYARETMSSATNLAVFFPFLEENSFAARLLGTIDLFQIWWLVSLSIGLGVLYKKRTGPIATTMLIVYAAIALILAAIRTALSGA